MLVWHPKGHVPNSDTSVQILDDSTKVNGSYLSCNRDQDVTLHVLFDIFKTTVVNCMFFLLFLSLFLAFQPPSNLFCHSALGNISKLKKNNFPFLSLSTVLAAVHSDILHMDFHQYGLKLSEQYFL